ncbi:MAG TPA: hypothetical protein VGJ48_10700 [Pyrinomonadaceae bacterium]
MDDVVLRCARRYLTEPANLRFVETILVKKNFGFDYENNFRRMLIGVIGLVSFERMEQAVNQAKKDQLKSVLGSLKTVRNDQAHTHIRGVTTTINAPSWTIAQFSPVYEGLIEFDNWLRNANL